MKMKRLASTAAVAASLFATRVAIACPACIGQKSSMPNSLKVVGVFLLVPFIVAAVVLFAIRAINAETAAQSENYRTRDRNDLV